jgi:hypothetical protein
VRGGAAGILLGAGQKELTIWTLLVVPRSDYWHVRKLGADASAGFKLWVNATQRRTGVFKRWLDGSAQRTIRVYVEFDERAAAKACGAFWCRVEKEWLFATSRSDDELPGIIRRRLQPPGMVAVNIPYNLKDAAKAAGFRWNASDKTWVIAQKRAALALARAPVLRPHVVK